jgi:hypothetical protein
VPGADERRREQDAVEHPLGHGVDLRSLGDDTVHDLVGRLGDRGDAEGGAAADEVVRVDLEDGPPGEEGDVIAVQVGEGLPPGEADDIEVRPRPVGAGGVLPGEGEIAGCHGLAPLCSGFR